MPLSGQIVVFQQATAADVSNSPTLVLAMVPVLLLLPLYSIDHWCLIQSEDHILLLRTIHCSPDSNCTEEILCPLSLLILSFISGCVHSKTVLKDSLLSSEVFSAMYFVKKFI